MDLFYPPAEPDLSLQTYLVHFNEIRLITAISNGWKRILFTSGRWLEDSASVRVSGGPYERTLTWFLRQALAVLSLNPAAAFWRRLADQRKCDNNKVV